MIDDLLAQIASAGWLLNNCYQHDAGLWRVNLRRPVDDGDWFTTWAEGSTFAEALDEAMDKMAQAEYKANAKTSYLIDPSKPSLLTQLGLTRPAQPVRRI